MLTSRWRAACAGLAVLALAGCSPPAAAAHPAHTPAVLPAKHATLLTGVSCTARFCLAVGATDAQYALAERWTRAGWQVLRTPDVNRIGYTVLDAVSCAAACVAVGTYNGSALVAERWDGHRWRLARYGPVTGPPSVSCAAECMVAPGPRWLRLRA